MGNLCLTRMKGEIVVLTMPTGERVELEVNGIERRKVKLTFRAPPSVLIHRGEVQARIDRGQKA